ncbi:MULTISPECIES: acyltransferase family protein [Dickeya]|uniref:Lysophospholipid acyltransferase n=1 Tax=Dickeya aquatica TaxID=1401087 RepID=A0A375ABC3_9GAMM|nr:MULTISPECIES: acyltransferase [Dickeya]SLM63408.1 Lysophospholipid acyltransferase [Dickeya aquatica]
MNVKERFIGLEWLRFLLGCYVMIYHTIHVYPQRETIPFLSELTSMGFFATSTFFVLSGFLLSHVYLRDGKLREPARHFLARRLFNLYPIHLIGLTSSIVVVSLMHWLAIPPDGPLASARFVIYDSNDPSVLPETLRHYMNNPELALNGLLQLLMLQAWNPYFLTFNAPLWSVSTLFFFYLLFPVLAPPLARSRYPRLWLILIFALYLLAPLWVIWHHLYGTPYTGLLQRNPLLRLPEFLAGILSYTLFRQYRDGQHPPLSQPQRNALAGFIGTCFILATGLFTHGEHYWYFLLHNGLLLPAQIALVWLFADQREPASEHLKNWATRLGAASLSIFALHVPLFNLFRTLEQLLRGDPWSCFYHWDAFIDAAGRVNLSMTGYALFLLTTVVLCMLFQEHVVVRMKLSLTARFLRPRFTPSRSTA